MGGAVARIARLVALAALIALESCGGVVGHPPAAPSPATSTVPTPPSTASPSAPQTPPAPVTFTGVVTAWPGTLTRFGPGMDMPAVDIEPAGGTETFDGWVRRPDDPPQADAITGRIEWWSRDWFHLADGRGWVHSAAVRGLQPAGLEQSPWTRPASVPGPSAALLDVPLDQQDQPVTCEVASLKMALEFRGIGADEASLLALTGIDDRPPELGPDGTILRWGDPDQAFDGDPAGHVFDRTGYGVYAAPIARAAAAAGATVLAAGTGIAPAAVYSATLAGHPVVAWVTNDYRPGQLGTWRSWDGADVPYSLTEHAVLVVGVTPAQVLLDDPWWGETWRTRPIFESAYATFDHMAVVIG